MQKSEKEILRSSHKSSEGEFIWELENSYELSPKLSLMILQTAKSCLLRQSMLKEGQIEVRAIKIREKSGRIIEELEKKRIILTIDNGIEDIEVGREYGRIKLRQLRLERITQEAVDQETVLSQEDLAKHLNCTVRTIQRDIREISKRGITIVTRGYLHNIGRGQTHKVKIISMYLEGYTYSEISRKTHHSIGAIKRYLESFVKVIMAMQKKIVQPREISIVTGLSEYLVKQYVVLAEECKKDSLMQETLKDLIKRSSYRPGIKKSIRRYSMPQAAMTGGLL